MISTCVYIYVCARTCILMHIGMPTDPETNTNEGVSTFPYGLVSKVPPFCWAFLKSSESAQCK